ncbi:Neelaredoxin [bacterium]|nr:Neelaredoxin [bacterium]
MNLSERIQTADWKQEKHVPVIECPDGIKLDEFFNVSVTLGKAEAHPNTTEHHICWITLYFQAEDDKFVHEVARFEFAAHGESAKGANQGPVYTHHQGSTSMKTNQAGTLLAVAYCNIHGLWQSSKEIRVG